MNKKKMVKKVPNWILKKEALAESKRLLKGMVPKERAVTIEEKRAALQVHKDYVMSQNILFEDSLEKIELDEGSVIHSKLERLTKLKNEVAKELSVQELEFVAHYFKTFSHIKAATLAGYNPGRAGIVGNRPRVKAYVAIIKKINEISIGITTEFVLEEFLKVAKVSISDLYDEKGVLIPPNKLEPHVAAAVAEIKEKSWLVGKVRYVEVTYKMYSKLVALDAVGKHVGLYEVDNRQKANNVSLQFTIPHNGRNDDLLKYHDVTLVLDAEKGAI